jgi:hypothetical protein
MKTLTTLLLAIAACGSFSAYAAEAVHTGVPLDIAKTISVTDTSEICGVAPVELVYEDSKGARHTVTYTVLGNGCSGD